jgi:hypothetical protein
MAKPVGPERPKLVKKLLRAEGVIREDLRQQLAEMNDRWESWKRKTDASSI